MTTQTTPDAKLDIEIGDVHFRATGSQQFISGALDVWLQRIMGTAPRQMVEGDLYA